MRTEQEKEEDKKFIGSTDEIKCERVGERRLVAGKE